MSEADIEHKVFYISFEETVERDKNRKFSVGTDVLKMQFDKIDLIKDFIYTNMNKEKKNNREI